jgi:DNA-damage-inducible protein J
MSTVQTQIKIEESKGISFEVKNPQYKPAVLEAMEEAKNLSKNPNVKRYSNVHEMFEEILNE